MNHLGKKEIIIYQLETNFSEIKEDIIENIYINLSEYIKNNIMSIISIFQLLLKRLVKFLLCVFINYKGKIITCGIPYIN